jgi:hypothetical protein
MFQKGLEKSMKGNSYKRRERSYLKQDKALKTIIFLVKEISALCHPAAINQNEVRIVSSNPGPPGPHSSLSIPFLEEPSYLPLRILIPCNQE